MFSIFAASKSAARITLRLGFVAIVGVLVATALTTGFSDSLFLELTLRVAVLREVVVTFLLCCVVALCVTFWFFVVVRETTFDWFCALVRVVFCVFETFEDL